MTSAEHDPFDAAYDSEQIRQCSDWNWNRLAPVILGQDPGARDGLVDRLELAAARARPRASAMSREVHDLGFVSQQGRLQVLYAHGRFHDDVESVAVQGFANLAGDVPVLGPKRKAARVR